MDYGTQILKKFLADLKEMNIEEFKVLNNKYSDSEDINIVLFDSYELDNSVSQIISGSEINNKYLLENFYAMAA